MNSKIVSMDDAISLIKDNDVVAIVGAGLCGFPEELAVGIEKNFLNHGTPKNLTIIGSTGYGYRGEKGGNHFAHEGLIKKVILGHLEPVRKIAQMISKNIIEGYCFPQGVCTQLYREIAAHKPGVITKIGLGTFLDPRIEGGSLNSISKDRLIEVVEICGTEYLLYKSFPINVALLRGTTSDEKGNISLEREACKLESLAVAQAVKNSGGVVLVQVERITRAGTINPWNVAIPGMFVDAAVVSENPELYHCQTASYRYNPSFSGEIRTPFHSYLGFCDEAKAIICKRAAMEIKKGDIVNVGIGMPGGVPTAAYRKGIMEDIHLTIEMGVVGGHPAVVPDFGASWNPEAIISHPSMFDFYHGGGLNIAFIGAGSVDKQGNVNVSKLGSRLVGPGGFIDITQTAQKIVFCTTFTTSGLRIRINDGKLNIVQEGVIKKFVNKVQQVTFNGIHARQRGTPVKIITERCVFELNKHGVVLVEIAPGIRIKEDIVDMMEFTPTISEQISLMPSECFELE